MDAYDRSLGDDANDRYNMLGNLGREFETGYQFRSTSVQKPISIGLSFGNRYNPRSRFEWGYFFNSTFSNAYKYREVEQAKYAIYNSGVEQKMGMETLTSEYSTNTGLAFSTGIKIYNNHKLSLHYIYMHRSNDEINVNTGFADNFDNGIYLSNIYEEKTINTISLRGDHTFDFLVKHRLEWNVNRGDSKLYQPDMKRLNYRIRPLINGADTTEYMQMDTYSWSAGPRLFTNGYDKNNNLYIKYYITFKDGLGDTYKIKAGIRIRDKNRAFERRSFYHLYATNQWGPTFLSSIPADITVENSFDDLGSSLVDSNYFYIDDDGNVHEGLIMTESTTAADAYSAEEKNNAVFLMFDFPLSFGFIPVLRSVRFVGGFRYENYRMDVHPYNPVTHQSLYSPVLQDSISAKLRDEDFLPSANLNIQLPKDMNIRLSYSRTVARPQFREVAPFAFQEFYGGDVVVGNPWLKTTDIYNYDFRFEWYPAAGEVIALSLFTKEFYNPIESSLMEASGKTYLTYSNAEYCQSSGIEFDVRRSLGFIPHKWGKTTIAGNMTYTQSRVEIDSTIMLYTGAEFENDASEKVRPLQGQSDYVFNLSIHYNNQKGFQSSLSFNTFSRRISSLGISGVPDEYELPFHSLNLTASYKINKFKISAKGKNLLNSSVKVGHENPFTGNFLTTKSYRPGMSFSLGFAYDF